MDLIQALKENTNRLLHSEGAGIELLKSLKRNPTDLRKLLNYAIIDIVIQNGKRYVCTANETLVKKFANVKITGSKVAIGKHDLFRTKNKNLVLAWDLVKNGYMTIVGNDWQILNFIAITEENVSLLHDTIVDLLKETK